MSSMTGSCNRPAIAAANEEADRSADFTLQERSRTELYKVRRRICQDHEA